MAIDPSISLGVRPVETLDLTKFQQLRNLAMQEQATQQQIAASQAQEALARAQLPGVALQQERLAAEIPGVRAEAEIRAREASFNRWLESAGKNQEYRNPDGTVNRERLSQAAVRDGFPDKGDAIMASHLQNLVQQSTLATNEQNRNKVILDATNAFINHTANTVSQLKDPIARAQMIKRNAEFGNKLMPGMGDQMVGILAAPDPKTGMFMADMNKVDAINKSSMTPLEAGNLAVAQQGAATSAESVRQAGIASVTGPEARNPNSAQSRQARAYARTTGFGNMVTDNMSAADIANLPGYKDAIVAATVPANAKTAALQAGTSGREAAVVYDNTADTLRKLKASGKLSGGITLSTFIQSNITGPLANDPDFRALQAAVTELSQTNPSINTNIGVDALLAQMEKLSKTSKDIAKTAERIVPATTFEQVSPTRNAAPTTPPPQSRTITRAQLKDYMDRNPGKSEAQIIRELANRGFNVEKK